MRRVAQLALAATFVIALVGGTAVSYARMAADHFPSPSWRVREDLRWYPTKFEAALSDHLAGRAFQCYQCHGDFIVPPDSEVAGQPTPDQRDTEPMSSRGTCHTAEDRSAGAGQPAERKRQLREP